MLLALFILPLGIGLYLRAQHRRRRVAARYGSFGLAQGATQRQLGARRHLPPALFLIGLTLLTLALARPQAVVSLPRIEGVVILAFDVSGSMAATDLAPTRIEAAKVAAQKFIDKQPSTVLIGVVAFSDSGFAVQTPTTNRDAILAAINRLTPQRGTALANGIFASLTTLAEDPQKADEVYSSFMLTPVPTPTPVPPGVYVPAAIVLLTDGENNQNPDPLQAAQAAAERGVRIYTVGLGSPAGVDLHINGVTVHTQLDESTLQQIAQLTGGTYYNADSTQALLAVYDNLNPQLVIKPEKMEVTSIFAGLSLLILLLGGLLSLTWFGRLP